MLKLSNFEIEGPPFRVKLKILVDSKLAIRSCGQYGEVGEYYENLPLSLYAKINLKMFQSN